MEDQLTKLRPDRDLQCYFYQPSAIAALSSCTTSGLTLSGCWRQQFDWAVIEWNRDNVFEHPALRNLPDGDLSGICLSYEETRTNCIPIDSTLYPTVDWPFLRVWADSNGQETIYRVPLLNYASPLSDYTPASAQFELGGAITGGDTIELSWLDQHFNYLVGSKDTLDKALASLAADITANQKLGLMTAVATGSTITLTYLGMPGSNGNRVGIYGTIHGVGTESWTPTSTTLTGGVTPATWQVNLNFSDLQDQYGNRVPTTNVRKLRWTWAADLQTGAFQRSEFSVVVSNWNLTGSNLQYSVAGPGSRRVEDNDETIAYTGTWNPERGNYSGGSVQLTTQPGATVSYRYVETVPHTLYLGTRYLNNGAALSVQVDGGASVALQLAVPGEDVLVRIPIATPAAGAQHTIDITHTGAAGAPFYFDFLEIAVPSGVLPVFTPTPKTTLATDWDTQHSQVLAPERTAWLINKLGFQGRANHYAGCLWFYELNCVGQQYASASITFGGSPDFGNTTSILLGGSQIDHVNLIGDTATTIAKCFELLINEGLTEVWAQSNGPVLTIIARSMGTAGNGLPIGVATNGGQLTAMPGSTSLGGGVDGRWITDAAAVPRLNRAARDWAASFFLALKSHGIAVSASFSMELGNGDDSIAAGIAQRYSSGAAAWLNTPSLQTNFSPQSTTFWQQVYLDMADVMNNAGVPVYLQFGEVQWWYFCPPADPAHGNWTPLRNSGMPFYDSYTTNTFLATFGTTMHVFTDPANDPTAYPNESTFLPGLIGTFTGSIEKIVQNVYPSARFEVLYPPDVNDAPLTKVINLPTSDWTPANLACLKTENFTYTGNRDLDQVRQSIDLPTTLGFPPSQSSHLIGISDYTTPWQKEWSLAMAAGLESIVLFALDQFCLIGYALPLDAGGARSIYMGG